MLLKVGLWFCFCFSNFLARNQFGGRKSATLEKERQPFRLPKVG